MTSHDAKRPSTQTSLQKELSKTTLNIQVRMAALMSQACKNMTACRNKASLMRERRATFHANFCVQEYARTRGRCLATGSHKYATQTTNDYNIKEVHAPT